MKNKKCEAQRHKLKDNMQPYDNKMGQRDIPNKHICTHTYTAKVLLNQVELVTKRFVCLCKDRNCSQYY